MRKTLSTSVMLILSLSILAQESFPIKVNKKWGLIDASGSIVIEPIYDAIGEFKEYGYAVMQRNGYVGMLNEKREEIILPEYDDLMVLDSTLIAVIKQEDRKVVNLDGKVILANGYESIQVWDGGFLGYMRGGKWGMVKNNGVEVCYPQFDDIRLMKTGYFQIQNGSKVGLMDVDGKIILDPKADKIEVYNNGLFFYQNDNKWGAVNQNGKVVIPQNYDRFSTVAANFLILDHSKSKDLYSIVFEKLISESKYDNFYPFSDQYLLCKKNRQVGLLDMEGNEALVVRYDEIQAFSENQFRVKVQNKWGVVGLGGSLMIPFDYDFIAPLRNKDCLVKIGRQFGVLNYQGRTVIPIEFDRIEMENDQAKAFKGEALSLYSFDDEGLNQDQRKFKKHGVITIGKKKRTRIRPAFSRSSQSDYSLEKFEWFYASKEDKWGLRKIADGSIKIKPIYHTINVEREYGLTIVGYEKMTRGVFERTTFRYEMVYGIVNNDEGKLVHMLDLLDIRMRDFDNGYKVARVVFVGGKHGLMSRDIIGKMVKHDYAYIGEFKDGVARMSIKGKLSGSLKGGQYGLGLLTDYLSRIKAPRVMLDYTLYDREFENKAQLICEECTWGYIDTVGNISIQPQFSFARDFVNEIGIVENERKWGAVDRSDKMVLPTIYDGVRFLEKTDNKILIVHNNRQKYGLIDTLGQVRVNLNYDKIGAFNEGRLAVKSKGRWGFVDTNGMEVIPCRFQRVKNFYNDLAVAKISNKWGVINKQGEVVIDFQYTRLGNFKDGLIWAYTSKGICYINAKNEVVIPAKFSKAFDFQDGLARVVVNGKYGLINQAGNYVVRPRYTYIEEFDENGLAIVRFGKSRIRYGVIDRTGRLITKHNYKQIRPFSEGYAVIKHKGKYGFINTKGNMVIPAKYSKVSNFREERASVQRDGLCGYIDTNGEEVVQLEFSKCLDFDDGAAVVYKGYRKGGLIDLNGNYMIKPELNRLYTYSDGRGLVRDSSYQYYYITSQSNNIHSGMYQKAGAFQHGVAAVQSISNSQWGIINQKGIGIISPKYDKIESFKDGYARVRIQQFSGLSSLDGELIVQPDYEYISYAGNGIFRVEQGDKIGYIDTEGNWVWEIKE